MDIEKLTKSQIVLLTLLTSFVSSIATGIVTVSLMEQAPPAIAQTVNRVIERTVEKVAESAHVAGAAAAIPQTETIVIRESDLIAEAIEKITPSVVRVVAIAADETQTFLGIGIVVRESGEILTDASLIDGTSTRILRSDGQVVSASVVSRNATSGIVRLLAATSTRRDETDEPLTWVPAAVATALPRVGETVLSIGGASAARLGHGIVTSHLGGGSQAPPEIETSISADAFTSGSPLMNINGEIVGLAATSAQEGQFIASSAILSHNNDDGLQDEMPQSAP